MAKIDFTKVVLRDNDKDLTKVIPDQIDPTKFVDLFKKHDRRINTMMAEAESFEITDDNSCNDAVSMGANTQAAIKELDALEKQIIKPYKDFQAAIRKARVMYTDRLEKIKALFASKVNLYRQKKRLEAEAEFKRQQEEQRKIEAKLKAEAKKAGVPAPEFNMPQIKKPVLEPVRTAAGTSYQKKRWTYEVTDIKKVPRKYLQLNKSMVTKDQRAHTDGDKCTLSIPGIRFYQVEDTVFKTG